MGPIQYYAVTHPCTHAVSCQQQVGPHTSLYSKSGIELNRQVGLLKKPPKHEAFSIAEAVTPFFRGVGGLFLSAC